MFFQHAGPEIIDDTVEFPYFPKNLPPMESDPTKGIYDVDITDSDITFTMVDNSGIKKLILPDTRHEHYYIDLVLEVATVTLVETGNIDAEVEILSGKEMMDRQVFDFMNIGGTLPQQRCFNGCIHLIFKPGSDLNELGQKVVMEYSFVDGVPDPEIDKMFGLLHARQMLLDMKDSIQAGLPIDQTECSIGGVGPRQGGIICATMPPTYAEIENLQFLIHPSPDINAGDNMDFYKSLPNMYELVKNFFRPLYKTLLGPDSCDSGIGVELSAIHWQVSVGPPTPNFDNLVNRVTRTMLVTSFLADTSPYIVSNGSALTTRRLKAKKSKKGKGANKDMDMATSTPTIERVFCGYNNVAEVADDPLVSR